MVCKQSQQWQQYVVCLPEWLWTYLLTHRGDLQLWLRYMSGFNGSSETCGCVKSMCWHIKALPYIYNGHWVFTPITYRRGHISPTQWRTEGQVLYGVPEHLSNSASLQGASCFLGTQENAWPQVPNMLFPTLCPDLFGLFQWIQTSNLCKYCVVVEVSLSQIIVKKKKNPSCWKWLHDATSLLWYSYMLIAR